MDNGGPAFPGTHQYFPDDTNYDEFHGMSLRDYFAGQALIAIGKDTLLESSGSYLQRAANLATNCYGIADAMLKAREVNHER